MRDFISEIKKINTDGLLYCLAELSIKMFQEQKSVEKIEIQYQSFGAKKTANIPISAWDILNIEYLSVINSNDYRQGRNTLPLGELVNLYRKYENEHSASGLLKKEHPRGVFRILLGMSAEQFQFNDMSWVIERFNRNYYILVAAKGFKHRTNIDTDAIVKEVFGYTANDYIAVLLTVFWLCGQHPLPLDAPQHLYQQKELTVLTPSNLEKLIRYYTCNYNDLRKASSGKQLLYARPFIETDRDGSIIASNMFLVAMLLGNGLYWIVRDYYNKDKGQFFVNAFGGLFEDYIEALAETYCMPSEWEHLREGKQKGADFLFDFGDVQLLIEAKSSLLGLDGKQQVPALETIDSFFERTVEKALAQLNSSYKEIQDITKVPILKIILLYDEFSNTALLQESCGEDFLNDATCYIMTIREFEILLYSHKHNDVECRQVLSELVKPENNCEDKQCISAVLEKHSMRKNHHFQGEMDWFSKLMDYLGKQLK